jgi:hypothetical protein
MADRNNDYDFELNLNFEGHKNPVEAFGQMAKMYERLITIDKHILYNILPNARVEYELADIEFSSIKSKVAQILKGIPDDILKDIANPGKLLGHALVNIKHRILKAVEKNEVQSKHELEAVTKDINKEIKQLSSTTVIILEVNNYFVLNAINDIATEGRKLKKTESFDFKSKKGVAKINNSSSVNMAKILFELGDQKFEQQRVEILKVKTLDLLSDKANWKLIREGKQIDVKILHQEWLDQYHNRKVIIQPNDYLKIDLKITYITSTGSIKPTIHYEALKVLEVIPPDKIETDNQNSLFN